MMSFILSISKRSRQKRLISWGLKQLRIQIHEIGTHRANQAMVVRISASESNDVDSVRLDFTGRARQTSNFHCWRRHWGLLVSWRETCHMMSHVQHVQEVSELCLHLSHHGTTMIWCQGDFWPCHKLGACLPAIHWLSTGLGIPPFFLSTETHKSI